MARRFTSGAETLDALSEGVTLNGTVTFDTRTKRFGTASYKCASGAYVTGQTAPDGDTVFLRGYFNFTAFPTALTTLLTMGGELGFGALVNNSGVLGAGSWDTPSSRFVLRSGQPTKQLVTGTWYRVELSLVIDGDDNLTGYELRVDGVTLARESLTISTELPITGDRNTFWGDQFGTGGMIVFVDDIGMNDNSGSAPHNTWLGEGAVLWLAPTADSAVGTNWHAGNGTVATSLFDAVNNAPPVGVAQASATTTSQIINKTSDTTGNYDAVLARYSAVGITAMDRISFVQPVMVVGVGASGVANSISLQGVSNPAVTAGTDSFITSAPVAGTHPSNWTRFALPLLSSPSVVLDTAPVLRVGKRSATANAVMVESMGMLVECVKWMGPQSLGFSRADVNSTTTVSVTRPSGAVTGGLLLLGMYHEATAAPVNANWTLLDSIQLGGDSPGTMFYLYARVDDGSAGPWSFTWDGSSQFTGYACVALPAGVVIYDWTGRASTDLLGSTIALGPARAAAGAVGIALICPDEPCDITSWASLQTIYEASIGVSAGELAVSSTGTTATQSLTFTPAGGWASFMVTVGAPAPDPDARVTLLDNFDHADGALGGNWLSDGSDPLPVISSNAAVGASGVFSVGIWGTDMASTTHEVLATVGTIDSAGVSLYVRSTASPAAAGYLVNWDNGGAHLKRSTTLVADFIVVPVAGDQIRVSASGDTINVMWKAGRTMAGWTPLGSYTDPGSTSGRAIVVDVAGTSQLRDVSAGPPSAAVSGLLPVLL